jgi:hypothetical protein
MVPVQPISNRYRTPEPRHLLRGLATPSLAQTARRPATPRFGHAPMPGAAWLLEGVVMGLGMAAGSRFFGFIERLLPSQWRGICRTWSPSPASSPPLNEKQ